MSALDDYFLSPDQVTNWFFGIGGNQISYLLFDDKRFY